MTSEKILAVFAELACRVRDDGWRMTEPEVNCADNYEATFRRLLENADLDERTLIFDEEDARRDPETWIAECVASLRKPTSELEYEVGPEWGDVYTAMSPMEYVVDRAMQGMADAMECDIVALFSGLSNTVGPVTPGAKWSVFVGDEFLEGGGDGS